MNYIYGTWSVLRGLGRIGADPRQEYVQRAVPGSSRARIPTAAGGDPRRVHAPELAGRGESIPSQTAWALLALFAAGTKSGPAVQAGIDYLLRTQQPEAIRSRNQVYT